MKAFISSIFLIYFQVFWNASRPLAMLIRVFQRKMSNFYLAQICLPVVMRRTREGQK